MNKLVILGVVIVTLGVGSYLISASDEADDAITSNASVTLEKGLDGKKLYEANCASCHGVTAGGTEKGPPFLHKVYVPGHHSDAAFVMAAKRGVRAHHWKFGDMPSVPAVSDADIAAITVYIRQLQRTAGIK